MKKHRIILIITSSVLIGVIMVSPLFANKVKALKNANILIELPAENSCTCDCVECENEEMGCMPYDYSKSGNAGYEACTEEEQVNHCGGYGPGYIDQHAYDITSEDCNSLPPLSFY